MVIRMMRISPVAVFRLMRPVNAVITMLSVWVAALITGTVEPAGTVALACLSAGLVAAAGNTINDFFDVDIDRINQPRRPLPAGLLSPQAARSIALLEFTAGILLGALISLPMATVALGVSLLLYFYSARLKGTVVWGNLSVSLAAATAFLYGGMAVNRPSAALFPALLAFFFHFGREVLKDLQDIHGDRQANAGTLPVRFGASPAVLLIWINFLFLMALTAIPFIWGSYSRAYFLMVAVGVYPVVLYVLVSLLSNRQPAHLGFLSNLLKADMLIGLLAVYLR